MQRARLQPRVRNSQRARLQPRVRHTPVLVDAHARSCESSSRVGPQNFFLAAPPIPMVKAFPKCPQGQSVPRTKAKSMPGQYTTRLETDEEAYNRITKQRRDAGMPTTSMRWFELRHTQDRARYTWNLRDLPREALEKKSEELKQRLLGSSLAKQARQKKSELKPEAKRMPRRMNAREFAPAHVFPARAPPPLHVCPFLENARETGHICAASCLNWVMCPSTEVPIRINQIACVQGYGNSSSEEDTDMD